MSLECIWHNDSARLCGAHNGTGMQTMVDDTRSNPQRK